MGKAIRYCDGGACASPAAWKAAYTRNNGEKCTIASCSPCLQRVMAMRILGIQEAQPLLFQPFQQQARPHRLEAPELPTPELLVAQLLAYDSDANAGLLKY